ncbi:cryptochrome/photolyase family protein [Bacillus weihaiensis]|uniref:cryptochrome/photolyase family protein n=1 Tax=Bacillus weihaiensis TaxID=1547283 RepID=UPI0023550EBC|nr:deoxyribodipyrimidine photo-lyase [Bacillus weihaiensis]
MELGAVWFRRDFRLQDHTALFEAMKWCKKGDRKLVFLFHVNTRFISTSIDLSDQYFFVALHDFVYQLMNDGIIIHLIYGNEEEFVSQVITRYPTLTTVFFNEDDVGYGLGRDQRICNLFRNRNVNSYGFQDAYIHGKEDVLKKDGTLYKVFTPYYKAWRNQQKPKPLLLDKDEMIKLLYHHEHSQEEEFLKLNEILTSCRQDFELVGQRKAIDQLELFMKDNVGRYSTLRNLPYINGTSRMSQFLRVGNISARMIFQHVINTPSLIEDERETFLKELAWRDFYHMIYANVPSMKTEELMSKYRSIKWNHDVDKFRTWCEGKTGYPIVDAGMRQLNSTGWMHNRLRMITASFLVKDYLIDWRLGAEYFSKKLIDYDECINIGSWQWCASVGTDAVPYFRVFNPITQSKKFDPEGKYIREFMNELKNVETKYIHQPWKMNEMEQTSNGCIIGKDYPYPTVEHKEQRKKAIRMFEEVGEMK